jgi:hypothetical protein
MAQEADTVVVVTDANVIINLFHIGQLPLFGALHPYRFRVPAEVVAEILDPTQQAAVTPRLCGETRISPAFSANRTVRNPLLCCKLRTGTPAIGTRAATMGRRRKTNKHLPQRVYLYHGRYWFVERSG